MLAWLAKKRRTFLSHVEQSSTLIAPCSPPDLTVSYSNPTVPPVKEDVANLTSKTKPTISPTTKKAALNVFKMTLGALGKAPLPGIDATTTLVLRVIKGLEVSGYSFA